MSDELNAASAHDEAPEPRAAVWRRMVCSGEGKVFFVGVLVLALYVGGLLMVRRHSVDDFNKLWTMTTTHVLAGRAAGLSLGYQQKLTPRVAIFCNIVIETFMVMIFYPLFVFCYHRLIVFQPLEDAMERAHHVAETHRETIAKFGVPGLLGFVLLPFWSIALQHIHDWLEAFGYYVPFAFVSLILATAVFVHLRYTFARRTPRASDPPDKQA
jgi:hypothetical protein